MAGIRSITPMPSDKPPPRQYLQPAVVRPEAGWLLVEERRAPETTRESGDGARERRERWLVAGWQV
jgi:hypothetical protein